MAKRIQKPRVRVKMNTRTEIIDQDQRPRGERERQALKQELDDVLDEIDDVLESNPVRGD